MGCAFTDLPTAPLKDVGHGRTTYQSATVVPAHQTPLRKARIPTRGSMLSAGYDLSRLYYPNLCSFQAKREREGCARKRKCTYRYPNIDCGSSWVRPGRAANNSYLALSRLKPFQSFEIYDRLEQTSLMLTTVALRPFYCSTIPHASPDQ